jgi:hypothetical protein
LRRGGTGKRRGGEDERGESKEDGMSEGWMDGGEREKGGWWLVVGGW